MKKTRSALLFSFVLTYSLYVYGLQPTGFFSLMRLGLAGIVGLVLFILFFLGSAYLPKRQDLHGPILWSVLSGWLLLNLGFVALFSEIPYTFGLLPTQTVQIHPLGKEGNIQIGSFSTELADRVGLNDFQSNAGWQTNKNRIQPQDGQDQALVWRGKPGQYAEIQFATCETCGRLDIYWSPQEVEHVDLAADASTRSITIRHDYPSLIGHKVINLLALQAAALLLSVIFAHLGKFSLERLHTAQVWTANINRHHGHKLPILGLAGLTVLAYGLKAQKIMFNDDWCIAYFLNFDELDAFMLYRRRPMHLTLIWLINQFVPIHAVFDWVIVFQVAILFITAALIYTLLHQILGGKSWFAFLIAALFLVFPSDYTRLYITMFNHRFAVVLMLVTLILSLKLIQTDKLVWGLAILPLLSISLLIYEGHLGLVMVWPLILLARYREQLSWKKLLGLSGFYLVGGSFVIWKVFVQPQFYVDAKMENLGFSPLEIMVRYFNSLKTLIGGFRSLFPDSSWLSLSNMMIAGMLLLCIFAFYAIASRLYRRQLSAEEPSISLKTSLHIFLAGGLLWLGGYVPIIVNYPANTYGHFSRLNLFSVPGAVLMLGALIYMLFAGISTDDTLKAKLTSLTLLPLIFGGALVQLQVQESYNRSWTEAQVFYEMLFDAVPRVESGTEFVFLLDGFEEHGATYRPIFSTFWEPMCALQTLYDEKNLMVSYHYSHMNLPEFPSFNVLSNTISVSTLRDAYDPQQLIVIHYDNHNRELQIQTDNVVLSGNRLDDRYIPYERIVPLENKIPSRLIVE